MYARAVAQPHAALRLVKSIVVFDAPFKMRGHGGSVGGKGLGGVGVQPAAPVLQGLRQVPVVQRDVRFNARRQQRINKAVVPGKARRVHLAGAGGENARPGDGKAVGLQMHGLHDLDVLGPAVVAVAGDVAGIAVFGFARRMAEGIPDGRPAPILERAALDLIGRRRRAPDKLFWKWHEFFLLIGGKT